MTIYIDPNSELPQNLGEIYSDRNIRVVGQARINPASPTQIDTIGLQIICSPLAGGVEGISTVADGTKTLGSVGTSMWIKITRSGTSTVVPEFYAAGSQPKARRDYVQVFYMASAGTVIAYGSYIIEGPYYIRFGYGIGQRVYDAIVGTAGDAAITHTDLQTAINDVASAVSSTGGWILVKKMCAVTTTITTPSGKPIKFYFQGYGTGLQASGSPGTGIQFGEIGCQIVGFGQITGFTTGVDLNNKAGCRLEMVFSGNGTNVNFGTLTSNQINFQGSYGLTENSHIETATTAGILGRWNNTKKRWEPISSIGGKTTITVDDTGLVTIAITGGATLTINSTTGQLTSTGIIQGATVIGAVYQ